MDDLSRDGDFRPDFTGGADALPAPPSVLSHARPWWRGGAIYQVYPRSFFDSNGDGIGDLPGVTARLDYIARLGVDAIWLCPFFVSPQQDFGYDVADYTAIDPVYGRLEDFDRLLDRAHALGLKVLLDQVWSHTSDRHPWFLESRAARTGPRADWYVWADPRPDGTPPNNWLSVFGGSAWRWEPRRRQYYLHHFLGEQPKLNLRNPAVADALLEAGEFWLRRGVDGFRLDAVDFMTHDPALRDNPARAPGDGTIPAKPFGLQHHHHDMLHPDGALFLHRVRALTDSFPGTCTLGEISSQDGAFDRVAAHTAPGGPLHMAYTLAPMRGGFGRTVALELIRQAARPDGWICWCFSNHDTERVATRWAGVDGAPDPRAVRMLVAFQLALRGSVCLYQGEELGLPHAQLRPSEMRDPFSLAYWPEFPGRDGSRTPMPWTGAAPQGGFSPAAPWLPLAESHRPLAVDAQERDPDSLLHECRRFLAWRQTSPVLNHGALHPLDLPPPFVGFVREGAGEAITCLFNLSPEPATLAYRALRPAAGSRFRAQATPEGLALPGFGAFFGAEAARSALAELRVQAY